MMLTAHLQGSTLKSNVGLLAPGDHHDMQLGEDAGRQPLLQRFYGRGGQLQHAWRLAVGDGLDQRHKEQLCMLQHDLLWKLAQDLAPRRRPSVSCPMVQPSHGLKKKWRKGEREREKRQRKTKKEKDGESELD